MGAAVFETVSRGESPRKAFRNAVDRALYESGHAGYTGTIAEKQEFINISLPKGEDPFAFANKLIDEDDGRIRDKWGPAGCIDISDSSYALASGKADGTNTYLFFGWASH